jgi:hypothetical protein
VALKATLCQSSVDVFLLLFGEIPHVATDTIENLDVLITGELFKEPTSFQRDRSHLVTFRAMRHKGDDGIIHNRPLISSNHASAPIVKQEAKRRKIKLAGASNNPGDQSVEREPRQDQRHPAPHLLDAL